MIDTLTIKGYRAIKTLTLHPKRINLLIGANNSGKSSILEFLSLLSLAHNDLKDVVGTDIWQYLLKTKQYGPQNLIHTLCPSATISIKRDDENISLSLNYEETGYSDQKLGGIISNKTYADADNYLLTTDFLKTLRLNLDAFDSELSSDSSGNQFATYTPISEEENSQGISLIEQELLSRIKQQIVQETYEAPKIIISVRHNDQITHVYAETLFRQQKRQTQSIFKVAGLSTIFTGLKTYEKPRKDIFLLPTAVRLKTTTNFSFINILFEKMMEGWNIQSFEKVISEKIPYVADIKKSTEKGVLVYIKGEDNPRPLSTMGDGFIALVEILALNTLVKKGIVIMEEPENNLHPGYIDLFSEQIIKDSSENQYFISTHNLDLIETILERAKHIQKLDDIALIILHKHMHLPYPVAEELSGREALEEIETIHSDLRGI
ncbi:MAG: AAA family ATPase [Methanospirillaceae archaeon]|nr:AAA family ATPase [Methanospirillaceae archaeon]